MIGLATSFVMATLFVSHQGKTVAGLHMQDAWGRQVDARGITLLDWEGQLANPAVKLRVMLPDDAAFPADVYVHGTSTRLHFDRSDADDRFGIGKRIRVPNKVKSVEFLVSMFPDRDNKDEKHELVIQLFGPDRLEQTRMRMPVRVIDQDAASWKPLYPIQIDYSYDKTGFFQERQVQRVLRQAADDWAYFIDQGKTDTVAAGAETSVIWNPDGYKTSYNVTNKRAYAGYLMYIYGIIHDENRAGGSPSLVGKPQMQGGKELPIRRSGSVEFDITGNWNRLGWMLTTGDEDWWHSGNQRSEQSDLYSIAIHEMGHALAFEGTYSAVGRAKAGAGLAGDALKAYLGQSPKIDTSDHLIEITDPVSHYGGFGREYQGDMKARRWLLTKSHLLCLDAIGYRIRRVSAFDVLTVPAGLRWQWRVGQPVRERIAASGGVPDYHFRVLEGSLPAGVVLDSFSGEISGVASRSGSYDVTLEVDDNDPTTPAQRTKVAIEVG